MARKQQLGIEIACFTGLFFLLLMILPHYGMSWDEITRWNSGDLKLDYYLRLFDDEGFFEVWGTAGNDNYPGLHDLPLAAADHFFDIDRFWLGHLWALFSASSDCSAFTNARVWSSALSMGSSLRLLYFFCLLTSGTCL